MSVDLPAFGKSDEARVRNQLQLQADESLFAVFARLGSSRRAVGGGDEARVAASAAPALRDEHALAFFREVRHRSDVSAFGILLEDERADRHRDLQIVRGLARLVGALAVLAALGFELGVKAEIDQRVLGIGRDDEDRAAACRRHRRRGRRADTNFSRRKLRQPRAAVAGGDVDVHLVDEHLYQYRG